MKRVVGIVEAVFDIAYLVSAISIGLLLISGDSSSLPRVLAGLMALVLAGGDAFHLLPRISVILTGREADRRRALGRGKQITSVTMTVFYMLLWHIGVLAFSPRNILFWSYAVYVLAGVRILLCLLPQNKWEERYSPPSWGVWRNVPFFLLGLLVAGLFFFFRNSVDGLSLVWLAVLLSFAFYLPVVLWAHKNKKIGMLMLPKTCVYLWLLTMCLSL